MEPRIILQGLEPDDEARIVDELTNSGIKREVIRCER